MTIRYFLLPAWDIFHLYNLERFLPQLNEYVRPRGDVLDNPVIFTDNILSRPLTKKDFSMFKRVHAPLEGTYVLLGLYLELLEYWGQGELIVKILQDMARIYSNHTCIAIYNHDHDFSKYNSRIPSNVRILNHGWTSSPSPHDIFIPFWKVADNPYSLPKTQFASFIGTPNNVKRVELVRAIRKYNNKDIVFKQVFGDEYLRELNSTLFSLCPRGWGVSSWRIFEVIQARSIPVILVDIPHFPMEDVVDWSKICVRLPETMIGNPPAILDRLRRIDPQPMLEALEHAREQFSLLGTQKYIVSRLTQS